METQNEIGMTAADVIKALQQDAPTTKVTVAAAGRHVVPVTDVRVMGYTDGVAVILTDD